MCIYQYIHLTFLLFFYYKTNFNKWRISYHEAKFQETFNLLYMSNIWKKINALFYFHRKIKWFQICRIYSRLKNTQHLGTILYNNENYAVEVYWGNLSTFWVALYIFSVSLRFSRWFHFSAVYNLYYIQKKHGIHSRLAMTDTFNGRQLSLISGAASQVGFSVLRRVPIGSSHIGTLRHIVLPRRASTSPEASRCCLCSSYNEFTKFCRGW